MSEPPSPSPTAWQRLADRLALALRGGVRVRVLRAGDEPVVIASGGPPGGGLADRLAAEVALLRPPGPGTLDVLPGDRRPPPLRAGGALRDPRFLQRVRNVLGNRLV